jgi:hypothetical protein
VLGESIRNNPVTWPRSALQLFDYVANITERMFEAGDKSRPGLSQRNAARRPREQRGAEPVLYAAHGVTDCRRAHAELRRRGREGPVPSNTNNDGQVAEEIAVQSCTVSHNVCDFNRLIEPGLRIHLCARPRFPVLEYRRTEVRRFGKS